MVTRGEEEIKGLFQTWPEAFHAIFQRKITKQELIDYLSELKKLREAESIRNQFQTFKPVEIDIALEVLNKHQFDAISESSPKSKKGK